MKVTGTTLIVHSYPDMFDCEKTGGKNCTVRIVGPTEWLHIADQNPTHIRVDNSCVLGRSFTRPITWMGTVGELFGKTLVVICWEQP